MRLLQGRRGMTGHVPDVVELALLYFHSAGTTSEQLRPFLSRLVEALPTTYIWAGDGVISTSPGCNRDGCTTSGTWGVGFGCTGRFAGVQPRRLHYFRSVGRRVWMHRAPPDRNRDGYGTSGARGVGVAREA